VKSLIAALEVWLLLLQISAYFLQILGKVGAQLLITVMSQHRSPPNSRMSSSTHSTATPV
jgi:hypothetical protein